MTQKVMYPGMVNSPETTITNNISESDTIIYVLDPARVPEPPNLMTLGTGTNAETVKVTEISGSAITVERGFQGIAKSWPAGTVIARNFTEYDYGALKDNIEDLDASKETPAGAQAKAEAAAGAVQAELDAHLADTVPHIPYVVVTGSSNTYAATLNPAPTAYTEGMALAIKVNVNNTGASTIDVNGLGAKPIKKANGNDVAAGNLNAGSIYTLRYNGVNFILQGEGGSGNAIASDLLSGKTASTDAGDIVGTMPNQGAMIITPGTTNQTIPEGYHNGAGIVYGAADLKPENIRYGVNLFGVVGTFLASSFRPYDLGVENIAMVEGYVQSILGSYSITKESNRIKLSKTEAGYVTIVTNTAIDLTNIKYIIYDIEGDGATSGVTMWGIASTVKMGDVNSYDKRIVVHGSPDISRQGCILDVSSLSDFYYVRCHCGYSGMSGTGNIYLYMIGFY